MDGWMDRERDTRARAPQPEREKRRRKSGPRRFYLPYVKVSPVD